MADRKLGDFITIALAKGTKQNRIYRKDMTDEEWARVKKNASDSGHLVLDSGMPGGDAPVELDPKGIDPTKPPEKSGGKVFPDRQNETPDAPPSETPKGKTEPSVKSDLKELKKVVSQVADVVKGKPTADEVKAANERYSKLPDDPNAQFATPPDTKLPPESLGQPTEEFKNDPTNPLVPVHRWQPAGKDVGPGVRMVDPTVDPELGPPPERDLVHKIDDFGNSIGQGVKAGVNAIGNGVEKAGNFLSNVLSPEGTPAPTEADPLDGPPTSQPVAQPPVAGQPPLGAGSPPSGPGGSLAASVKTTTPGSGGLPTSADPYAADRKQMESAAQLAMDAESQKSEVARHRAEQESKLLNDKILYTAENEKKRVAAVDAYDQVIAHGQETANAIMDERRKLMNTKIDPDAYYTKGGVGRAVLSTISAAAFGFGGQGMQFLQRMDNLAQQEVKNQQDELARRSGELSTLASENNNVVAMGKERGLTTMQSIASAKDAFYASVEDQIKKLAFDSNASDPAVAANLAANLAAIQAKRAETGLQFSQATQLAAHQSVQDRVAMMNAQTQRMEASAKIGMGGKLGGGWQEMKPSQQKDIQGLLAVGRQIGDMSKQWNEQAGSPVAALTQHLGLGMEMTDPSKWKNSSSKFHAQTIGTVLEKGKLTDADFPKYLDSFIPSAGNTKEAALNRVNNLVRYAVTQYATEINSLDASLVRSIGLPTPAEYQQMLVRDINDGSRGSVPGEKPYGAR